MSPEQKLLRAILGGSMEDAASIPVSADNTVDELWDAYLLGIAQRHLTGERELSIARASFMAGMISMSAKVKAMTEQIRAGGAEGLQKSRAALSRMNHDLNAGLREIPALLRAGREEN